MTASPALEASSAGLSVESLPPAPSRPAPGPSAGWDGSALTIRPAGARRGSGGGHARRRSGPSVDRQTLARARRDARRWLGWTLPPAGLFGAVLMLRLDPNLAAVCMIGLAVVVIRAVQAYGDYRQLLVARANEIR